MPEEETWLRSHWWTIGTLIYVLGFIALGATYELEPAMRFGTLITSLTYISIVGVFLVMFVQIALDFSKWGRQKPSKVEK